jgi:hypothetical protein
MFVQEDTMMIYRQGDVLLVKTEAIDVTEVPEIERDNGRIILAEGETTGHAHAVADVEVKFFQVDDARILVSPVPFSVRHEEHATIQVPAGTFRVVRQREYSPLELRTVRD